MRRALRVARFFAQGCVGREEKYRFGYSSLAPALPCAKNRAIMLRLDFEIGSNHVRRKPETAEHHEYIRINSRHRSGGCVDLDGVVILWDLERREEIRRVQLSSLGGMVYTMDSKIDSENNRGIILRTTPITRELILSEIDLAVFSQEELIEWAEDNRYVQEFLPSECARYRIPEPCGQAE